MKPTTPETGRMCTNVLGIKEINTNYHNHLQANHRAVQTYSAVNEGNQRGDSSNQTEQKSDYHTHETMASCDD